MVLLADIREDGPAWDTAADIVVNGVSCTPTLVAEVIPGEQGLFEACIRVEKGWLCGDFTGCIEDACTDFGEDKVAISSAAWPALWQACIGEGIDSDTAERASCRDIQNIGIRCIVWTAGEDGLVWADGEDGASFCGRFGWRDGFPVLLNRADSLEAGFPTCPASSKQRGATFDFGFRCCDAGIHGCDGLFVGFIDNRHPGLACGDDAFLNICKKGTEGVEVTRRDRVKFVVVALSAGGCLAEPDGSDGADTIGQIAGFVVLGLCAAFLGGEEEAVESGADLGFLVGIREDIAGELLACKAVKRLVCVEGLDDVVAVWIDVPRGVGVVPDGVCKADDIQPVLRHFLAIVRACKEAVDEVFVGLWRLVIDECLNFGIGRREAGQVEGQSADEGAAVGLRAWLETDFGEVALDQKVDGVFALWNHGLYRKLIGPVLLVSCAFANPAAERIFLCRGDGLVEVRGWHCKGIGCRLADPLHQLTGDNIPRDDGAVWLIEAQVCLAFVFVGAMTRKTAVRKDGPDIAVEDDFGCLLGGCGEADAERDGAKERGCKGFCKCHSG